MAWAYAKVRAGIGRRSSVRAVRGFRCKIRSAGHDQLQCGVAFGKILGVEANDMTVCDIELLNGRARQKAASSVAHKLAAPPPLEDRETRL